MSYSVIIPSHNEGEYLHSTVRSFFKAAQCCDEHHEGLEIVVVSDSSTDGSIARLKEDFTSEKLITLEPKERLGTSRARKLGVAASHGDMIISTDAHMSVKQGWLHDLEESIEACGPGARDRMIFGPRMHNINDEKAYEQGEYWPTPDMQLAYMPIKPTLDPYPVMTLAASGHIMSRKFYDGLGGGYLRLFAHPHGIDEELGLRSWVAGGECRVLPRVSMSTPYRSEFPYEVPILWFTFNHLMLARMYFDDDRFVKVMRAQLETNEQPTLQVLAIMTAGRPHEWAAWVKEWARRSIDEVFSMFGVDW